MNTFATQTLYKGLSIVGAATAPTARPVTMLATESQVKSYYTVKAAKKAAKTAEKEEGLMTVKSLREVFDSFPVFNPEGVLVNPAGTLVLMPLVEVDGKLVPDWASCDIFSSDEEYFRTYIRDMEFIARKVNPAKVSWKVVTGEDITTGTKRIINYAAISGIPPMTMAVIRYGTAAYRTSVLKLLKPAMNRQLVESILEPNTPGAAFYSPWVSHSLIPFGNVGLGYDMAAKFAKRLFLSAEKAGITVNREMARFVIKNPELIQGVHVGLQRQPVHDPDCMTEVSIIVTDFPGSSPLVSPETMKAMLGDQDGDATSIFTGAQVASLMEAIAQIQDNYANRNCTVTRVMGYGFDSGSILVGGREIDLNSVIAPARRSQWLDFQGFKTKEVLGSLVSISWQYNWVAARLLSDEELIDMSVKSSAWELAQGNVRRANDVRRLGELLQRKSDNLQVRARLASNLSARCFGPMCEHVLDARKGKGLAYDPISNLNALRSTGRFNFVGMKEEGVWTDILELMASKIWRTVINPRTNREVYQYNPSEVIRANDTSFHRLVCMRNSMWKGGTGFIETIAAEKEFDLEEVYNSVYLTKGYIPNEPISVPENLRTNLPAGQIVDQLEGVKPFTRSFVEGPKSFKEMREWLGKNYPDLKVVFKKDENGDLFIHFNDEKKFIGNFIFSENTEGFDGKVSPYTGHLVWDGSVMRAAPPTLFHEWVNPFCERIQRPKDDMLTELPAQQWKVYSIFGVIGSLIVGAAQQSFATKKSAWDKQFIAKAAGKIRDHIQGLETVRNIVGQKTFADLITTNFPEIKDEYRGLVEDQAAVELYKAGFSLLAVGKSKPMSKFLAIDPALGVPRIIPAYDSFWQLRVGRRYDREATSVLRQVREFANPREYRTGNQVSSQLGNYRQMVKLAFFNTDENSGGHDPVHMTPSGMAISESKDISWIWVSKEKRDLFYANLPEDAQIKVRALIDAESKVRAVTKTARIDENIIDTLYLIPVDFGGEQMEGTCFKANFPGTKAFVQPCGIQFVASHKKIMSFNGYKKQLAEGTAMLVDGVMPVDTVVAKGAYHLLMEAATSQLKDATEVSIALKADDFMGEGKFMEIVSAKLKEEGKDPTGKMFIYRLEGDEIKAVTGPDGKVLKAVVGDIPMYRTPFESSLTGNTMTKMRSPNKGLTLGHMERVIYGEFVAPSEEEVLHCHILRFNMRQLNKWEAKEKSDREAFVARRKEMSDNSEL